MSFPSFKLLPFTSSFSSIFLFLSLLSSLVGESVDVSISPSVQFSSCYPLFLFFFIGGSRDREYNRPLATHFLFLLLSSFLLSPSFQRLRREESFTVFQDPSTFLLKSSISESSLQRHCQLPSRTNVQPV